MTRAGVARALGGAVALVTIAVLSLKVASLVIDEPELAGDSDAAEPPPTGTGLSVSAIERVHVRVEVDGEERFAGVLCPRCENERFEVEAAREIAVELSDLTRARVIYNGSRVEPLGNLSAPRRLVFVDDR